MWERIFFLRRISYLSLISVVATRFSYGGCCDMVVHAIFSGTLLQVAQKLLLFLYYYCIIFICCEALYPNISILFVMLGRVSFSCLLISNNRLKINNSFCFDGYIGTKSLQIDFCPLLSMWSLNLYWSWKWIEVNLNWIFLYLCQEEFCLLYIDHRNCKYFVCCVVIMNFLQPRYIACYWLISFLSVKWLV